MDVGGIKGQLVDGAIGTVTAAINPQGHRIVMTAYGHC
jgi:hypothetical protein